MGMRLTQLQCKEVICVSNGRRLGFIEDVEVEIPEGTIHAILVPGSSKALGLLGRKDDLRIPWHCIRRIGPDIILVDCIPEECRVPRGKPLLP